VFIVTKVKEITEASASVGLLLATAVNLPMIRIAKKNIRLVYIQWSAHKSIFSINF